MSIERNGGLLKHSVPLLVRFEKGVVLLKHSLVRLHLSVKLDMLVVFIFFSQCCSFHLMGIFILNVFFFSNLVEECIFI